MSRDKVRILAISSGGGHWVQLLRLRPAFEGCDVAFVTVHRAYRNEVPNARFYRINDATRWNKWGLIKMAVRILLVMLRERPDVIVSTGAAPGYFALRCGKFIRARTVWLDSIANVDSLSMAGERAGRFADLWLTQWQHLERPLGPWFVGAML